MGESNTVVSAYTLYRHLQQYCSHPSEFSVSNVVPVNNLYFTFVFQAPYLIYVEILQCENTLTSQIPNKMLENTLRYTRSEEDLNLSYYHHGNTSPRDFSVYGNITDFDDADCWSQEDDEIIQVSYTECISMGECNTILSASTKYRHLG